MKLFKRKGRVEPELTEDDHKLSAALIALSNDQPELFERDGSFTFNVRVLTSSGTITVYDNHGSGTTLATLWRDGNPDKYQITEAAATACREAVEAREEVAKRAALATLLQSVGEADMEFVQPTNPSRERSY